MKRLFTMDLMDYPEGLPRFRRPSVRAVIMAGAGIAMVHSKKFDYYKFPGGGIESGEDHVQALVREVREETGLSVIPDTVRELGSVLRVQLSQYAADTVFEQENYYYVCEVTGSSGIQSLDDYEFDEGFKLEYITPQTAIDVNRTHDHSGYDPQLVEREALVLEYIMNNPVIL
ncbi:MAG: NUDIX domain-containing protein [Ruminococcus sp.]|nr:NUDIX domain-containing protein [Ruminococcus sp.]